MKLLLLRRPPGWSALPVIVVVLAVVRWSPTVFGYSTHRSIVDSRLPFGRQKICLPRTMATYCSWSSGGNIYADRCSINQIIEGTRGTTMSMSMSMTMTMTMMTKRKLSRTCHRNFGSAAGSSSSTALAVRPGGRSSRQDEIRRKVRYTLRR